MTTHTNETKNIIEMKNISMEFPGVKALSNADFRLESGEVRAVVGANGAGKSTLMKVLAGANRGYTGDIYFNGEHHEIRDPLVAKNLGIEIVYQEVDVALFSYLTVAENIMFNYVVLNMQGKFAMNWSYIRKEAKKVLKRLNVNLDVNRLVSSLSLAQKQMVLIARAVQEDCKFLILDEPTAPLSVSEADELFRIVRDLSKNQGVGIVFISHRLPELFQICESFTVMLNGETVANKPLNETVTNNDIVSLMLGRSFDENFPKREVKIGEVVFEANNLCNKGNTVKDACLYTRSGEIVGLAGLVGAGKTELCKLLFGADKLVSGHVKHNGKEIIIKNPTVAIANKIALIPEERRKEGVLVSESVYFNLSVACLSDFTNKFSFVNKKAELKNARKYIEALGIRTPSEYQEVMKLSGGNQQKVAIGKWLAADADLYIMDEPTKGVDVGAKQEIFELILKLAESGKSIIYVSAETSELLAITDRIYVMYSGRIAAELETKNADEQQILHYSTGGQ